MTKYQEALKDAIFVDFELVGIGDRLTYLRTERFIRTNQVDPELESLVNEIGAEFDLIPHDLASAYTEACTAQEYGF